MNEGKPTGLSPLYSCRCKTCLVHGNNPKGTLSTKIFSTLPAHYFIFPFIMCEEGEEDIKHMVAGVLANGNLLFGPLWHTILLHGKSLL